MPVNCRAGFDQVCTITPDVNPWFQVCPSNPCWCRRCFRSCGVSQIMWLIC